MFPTRLCRLLGSMSTADRSATRLFLTLEAAIALVLLVLFLHNYRYRDLLWQAGGEKGWNSDPKLRVYFYANYKDPPDVPEIWSQGYANH